ncbi:hypothetical protein ID47_08405 [Candidatus Paracaedibacter acanthamoebae]|uniref:Uncharacterized protein n=1 Tax=Candidatus Odyssella acanthamoebae TaxID=91604 RepID=A0A077AYN8_9PROT|nr:hypothetical protein ID47_08405 [Candidatus Paracaedibacter acanthamoebae]
MGKMFTANWNQSTLNPLFLQLEDLLHCQKSPALLDKRVLITLIKRDYTPGKQKMIMAGEQK